MRCSMDVFFLSKSSWSVEFKAFYKFGVYVDPDELKELNPIMTALLCVLIGPIVLHVLLSKLFDLLVRSRNAAALKAMHLYGQLLLCLELRVPYTGMHLHAHINSKIISCHEVQHRPLTLVHSIPYLFRVRAKHVPFKNEWEQGQKKWDITYGNRVCTYMTNLRFPHITHPYLLLLQRSLWLIALLLLYGVV